MSVSLSPCDQEQAAGRYRANCSRKRQPVVCRPTAIGLRNRPDQRSGIAVKTKLLILSSGVIRGWLETRRIIEAVGRVLLYSRPLNWLRIQVAEAAEEAEQWTFGSSFSFSFTASKFSFSFSSSIVLMAPAPKPASGPSKHQSRPSISDRRQVGDQPDQKAKSETVKRRTSLVGSRALEDLKPLSVPQQPAEGSSTGGLTPSSDSGHIPLPSGITSARDDPAFTGYRSPQRSPSLDSLPEQPAPIPTRSSSPTPLPDQPDLIVTETPPSSHLPDQPVPTTTRSSSPVPKSLDTMSSPLILPSSSISYLATIS